MRYTNPRLPLPLPATVLTCCRDGHLMSFLILQCFSLLLVCRLFSFLLLSRLELSYNVFFSLRVVQSTAIFLIPSLIPVLWLIFNNVSFSSYLCMCGSCSCHEHTTNLTTGVSRQPVLDCGTIFHSDCGGRDFPSILSDDLWKHTSLATEAPRDSFDL